MRKQNLIPKGHGPKKKSQRTQNENKVFSKIQNYPIHA